MNKSYLETQANTIDLVMYRHNIPVRVEGGTVAPRSITFTLSHSLPKDAPLESELAQALGVADVSLVGRIITIHRTDARPVELLPMLHNLTQPAAKPFPTCTAVLGLCDDGAPLLIRLPSDQVGHVLVTGDDEHSTTSLLQTIAMSLAVMNRPSVLCMILIGQAFSVLAYLPNVLSFITDDERADKAMGDLLRRLARGDAERAPRVVVLIDGLTDIAPGGNLARLLKEGNAAGVYVVASGNVSPVGFGTLIRGRSEPGDFEATCNNGDVIRFTSATLAPAEINQVTSLMGLSCYAPRR